MKVWFSDAVSFQNRVDFLGEACYFSGGVFLKGCFASGLFGQNTQLT